MRKLKLVQKIQNVSSKLGVLAIGALLFPAISNNAQASINEDLTDTLSYSAAKAATAQEYIASGLQLTVGNLSTCQTMVYAIFNCAGYNGTWSSAGYDYYVNDVKIGSSIGRDSINISAYMPVVSVKLVKTNQDNWNTGNITVGIVSPSSTMPASAPIVTSPVNYVVNETANP